MIKKKVDTSIPTTIWLFRAYESEIAYNAGEYFDEAYFTDFDVMKQYSAEVSANWEKVFPLMLSNYWKFTLDK